MSKPIETDLGGVWVLEDEDANVIAEVDVTKLPDGRRLTKYRDLAGNEKDGAVAATDVRDDDELARDVFLLRGKTTKPTLRRKP